MYFKKVRGKAFGVVLNADEEAFLNSEIDKQILKNYRESCIDNDASILWALHQYAGWGKQRLEKFWGIMYAENKRWEDQYDLERGESAWIAHKALSEIGVDVHELYRKAGLYDTKKSSR